MSVGFVLKSSVDWLDTAKRNAWALTGLAMTEYGALGGGRRITWNFLGRYMLTGGGFLSTITISHILLFKGYHKAGYQLGMFGAVLTGAAGLLLNFTPLCRVAVLGGSAVVFGNHYSRLRTFQAKQATLTQQSL